MAKGYWVDAYRSISDPSYAEALTAYRGDEYQRALQLLGDAVERDMRVVEGLD
jgi:uncharacterized protein (DUF1330 family)